MKPNRINLRRAPGPNRTGAIRLRLWHLFLLVALAALIIPQMKILGTNRAVMEIEDLQLNLDEQWGKRWATFDCRFHEPSHLTGEPLHCFIEVGPDFTFGKHKVGDKLNFRYQEEEFSGKNAQDPRQLVLKKFFGLNAVPSKFEDGLYIRVGIEDPEDPKEEAPAEKESEPS